jgi:hypothetical protein
MDVDDIPFLQPLLESMAFFHKSKALSKAYDSQSVTGNFEISS